MQSGVQAIYRWMGVKPPPGAIPIKDNCWLCGGDEVKTGKPIKKAINLATFADTNLAQCPQSPVVCSACVWSLAGKPPNTLRLRSHLFLADGTHHTPTRQEWVKHLVLSPPEPPFIALIAVSGQKHLAFRARVALGKSMFPVQFESERLWVRRENLEETLTIYEKLLALGCSKTAVDTGKYKYSRLKEHWVEIERLETELQSMRYGRGSAGFSLVGFIARKPEKEKKRG